MPQALPTRAPWHGVLIMALTLAAPLSVAAQELSPTLTSEAWTRPPEHIAQAVLAPRYRNVTLSNASPDRKYFLRTETQGMPTMASFAREHLWFGGLQVDPRANRARNFTTGGSQGPAVGLTLIEAETGRTVAVQVPRGATVSGARWAPDGRSVAYFANFDDGTHIHIADLTGRSRQLTRTHVLATIQTSLEWTPDGSGIVTVLVPENRGVAPQPPAVPAGPKVRVAAETDENRTRTYASLLQWPHERDMLEYYATGQLAVIDVASRNVRKVGAPAMIRGIDPGPKGEFIRVTTVQKPFSYIVPFNNFGTREELWAVDGRVVAKLSERALDEGVRSQPGNDDDQGPPRAGQPDPSAMRAIAWRPDGAGLSYLQQEPAPPRRDSAQAQDSANSRARRRDRVFLWRAPFDEASRSVVYESDTRIGSVRWSPDARILFVTEGSGASMRQYAVFLDDPSKKHEILRGRSGDNFYNDPGSLMGVSTPFGEAVRVSSDGSSVFLSGTKYFEDRERNAPQQFVDRVDIRTGAKSRIYEAENASVSERIVEVLDQDVTRLVVSRESPTQVPDSYLRANGQLTKLTNNRDYNPEITNAQRKTFTVTRADGFQFKVDVTLPQNWTPGQRLPALFWFYPREFTDQESYDRTLRTYNRNRFPNLGVRSMEFMTLAGYAVVAPDAPIIGESGRMNDNYEHDLRNNLAATIDHLDREGVIDRERLGVGGHSYGAFSTVNAMVHTPFFKAGIAGDGAYNRTLTPLGFQTERRDLYQGRETYLGMSPFLYANNLTGALLMYHGMDDQNVGTDPINSTRLFHVLNGLGKTASLYMYPYEDHGPATQETIMDLWGRWVSWMDTYVKNAKTSVTRPAA